MNLPNKLTALRILMIPLFMIITLFPFDWGTLAVAQSQIAVNQLIGAIIFAIASFAMIVLVGQGLAPSWVVSIIISRELAVTGLRLLLVKEGEVMAAAWPGKIKTATQMVAIILLFLDNFPFQAIGIPVADIMLYLCLVFTIYSGVDYFIKNKHVFVGSM